MLQGNQEDHLEHSILDDMEDTQDNDELLTDDVEDPQEQPIEEPESKEDAQELVDHKEEESDEANPQEFFETVDGTKIPKDAYIEKKIDGEVKRVALSEVIDAYSGKVAVEKRFSEANTIKQKAEHQMRLATKEKEDLVKTVTSFNEAIKNGWWRDAITSLSKLTNEDPEQGWKNFQQMQRDNLERLQKLTPDEWEHQNNKEEAEYWKRQAERERNHQQSQQDSAQLEQQIDSVCQENDFSREEFDRAYYTLVDMVENGAYTGVVDIKAVTNVANDIKIWGKIEEVVSSYLPEKIGDNDFYSQVLVDTKKYGITFDQWVSFIKEETAPTKKVTSKQEKNALVKPSPSRRKNVDDESDYLGEDDVL